MEVEFSLIPEDFVALGEFQLSHRSKRRIFLFLGLIILTTGAIGLVFAQILKIANIFFWLMTAVVALSACLMYLLEKPRVDARWVRRELSQGKNVRFLEPRKITISPAGISNLTACDAGMTMWTGIEKIAVTKDHAFIYTSISAAIIVPRRTFASDLDFTYFVETAQQYFEAANKELQPA